MTADDSPERHTRPRRRDPLELDIDWLYEQPDPRSYVPLGDPVSDPQPLGAPYGR